MMSCLACLQLPEVKSNLQQALKSTIKTIEEMQSDGDGDKVGDERDNPSVLGKLKDFYARLRAADGLQAAMLGTCYYLITCVDHVHSFP